MTAAAVLPPLREDLTLSPGPLSEGQPTWSIYDPARHRFVRLGWLDFEILSRWGLRAPDAILAAIAAETTLRPSTDDIVRFAKFARGAGLLQATTAAETAQMAAERAFERKSAASWLVHNYLFLRLRLVNPDRFLTAALPLVRWIFTRAGMIGIATLGVLALFLISRDWERYSHSLIEQTTVDGLIQMGIAISFAKVFHELGHGFATKLYGCRVPSMGIAFLVMWPVLWTDTTDAWRLTDRRQRLVIDSAGMGAEILIAAVASIAWAVLPDGPTRSAMFVLSSSTWLLTLLVNISPLMRFDGYYILSDLLDFPNLQERGFAYTRWLLREMLFRPNVAPPEQLPPHLVRVIVTWSIATWIYRFFLFMGIAVLVYHLTFKVLGVVLMVIEIWFFVARPIVKELGVWAKLPTVRKPNRYTWGTLAVFALLLLALLVPWRGRVDAPALLRAERQAVLLAAEPGRLVSMISEKARVTEGQVLFRMDSVEIDHDIAAARAQLEAAQAEQTAGTYNPERRRAQQATLARTSEAGAALARSESRAGSLEVTAPFAGEIRDIPSDLRVGAQIRRLERLGVLVAAETSVVEAFVSEADLDRVQPGAAARFIQVDGDTLSLKVAEVAHASTRALEVIELASTHEGPISVRRGPQNTLIPEHALYRVLLVGERPLGTTTSRTVGTVVIDAPPRSIADIIYRRAVALFLREASP
ncbi:HlyD family efflux transporter periplasmic adaptor subunit [Reyranella sp.]|uniref:HlyD family efflux transporter periplasmic adaptor subunit n=1 Tax=Reyranella sp. TaxID=1929291 RepID=UPI00121783C5|nr:HlyD family efflux transporter periplasmic adaptor subunit [Reyranella sp.]TAJ83689.1 MAG: HlyD family efflux transporter periplasmic adaptor subunit [Reyranella sp.]